MSEKIWLLRHGDTEWTEEELHTGRREVPLSEAGREQARAAGGRLARERFDHVLVSPQVRAQQTCELAGFAARARDCPELVEWDYGDVEGLGDAQTEERHPGWDLFRDGAPGGESVTAVIERADRVLSLVGELAGTCLLIGHGKMLRALAARFLAQEITLGSALALGAGLALDPGAISLLEREADGPLLRLWNYTGSP